MSVSSAEASVCLSGYQGVFKDQVPGLPTSVQRNLWRALPGACRREKTPPPLQHVPSPGSGNENV